MKYFLIAELQSATEWLQSKYSTIEWMHYLSYQARELTEEEEINNQVKLLSAEYEKQFTSLNVSERDLFKSYSRKMAFEQGVDTKTWPTNWEENPVYLIRIWSLMTPGEIETSIKNSTIDVALTKILTFHNEQVNKANISSEQNQINYWTEQVEKLTKEQKFAVDSILEYYWSLNPSKKVPISNDEFLEFVAFCENANNLTIDQQNGKALMYEIRRANSKQNIILVRTIYAEAENYLSQEYVEEPLIEKENAAELLGYNDKKSIQDLRETESILNQEKIEQENLKKETKFIENQSKLVNDQEFALQSCVKFEFNHQKEKSFKNANIENKEDSISISKSVAENFQVITPEKSKFIQTQTQKKYDARKRNIQLNAEKNKLDTLRYFQKLQLFTVTKNPVLLDSIIDSSLLDFLDDDEILKFANDIAYKANYVDIWSELKSKVNEEIKLNEAEKNPTPDVIAKIKALQAFSEKIQQEIDKNLQVQISDDKVLQEVSNLTVHFEKAIKKLIVSDPEKLEKWILNNDFLALSKDPMLLMDLLEQSDIDITKVKKLEYPKIESEEENKDEKTSKIKLVNLIIEMQIIYKKDKTIPDYLKSRYERYLADYEVQASKSNQNDVLLENGIPILPAFDVDFDDSDSASVFWLNDYNKSVVNGKPDSFSYQKFIDNTAKKNLQIESVEYGKIIHPKVIAGPFLKIASQIEEKESAEHLSSNTASPPAKFSFIQPPYPDYLLFLIEDDALRSNSPQTKQTLNWTKVARTFNSEEKGDFYFYNHITTEIERVKATIQEYYTKGLIEIDTSGLQQNIIYYNLLLEQQAFFQNNPTRIEKIQKYKPSVQTYAPKYQFVDPKKVNQPDWLSKEDHDEYIVQYANINLSIEFYTGILSTYSEADNKEKREEAFLIIVSLEESLKNLEKELDQKLQKNEEIYNKLDTNSNSGEQWQVQVKDQKSFDAFLQKPKYTDLPNIPDSLKFYYKDILDQNSSNPESVKFGFNQQDLRREIENAKQLKLSKQEEAFLNDLEKFSSTFETNSLQSNDVNNVKIELGGEANLKVETEIKPAVVVETKAQPIIFRQNLGPFAEKNRKSILNGDISLFLDEDAESLLRRKYNLENDEPITILELEKFAIETGIVVDHDDFVYLMKQTNDAGYLNEINFYENFYNNIFYRSQNFALKKLELDQNKEYVEKRKVEISISSERINKDNQKNLDVTQKLISKRNNLIEERNLISQRFGFTFVRPIQPAPLNNEQELKEKWNASIKNQNNKQKVESFVDLTNFIRSNKISDISNFIEKKFGVKIKTIEEAQYLNYLLGNELENIDPLIFQSKYVSNFEGFNNNPNILKSYKLLSNNSQKLIIKSFETTNFNGIESVREELSSLRNLIADKDKANYDIFVQNLLLDNPEAKYRESILKNLAPDEFRYTAIREELNTELTINIQFKDQQSKSSSLNFAKDLVTRSNSETESLNYNLELKEFKRRYPNFVKEEILVELENIPVNQLFSFIQLYGNNVDLTILASQNEKENLAAEFNLLNTEITNLKRQVKNRIKNQQSKAEERSRDSKIISRTAKILSIRGGRDFQAYASISKPIIAKSRSAFEKDPSARISAIEAPLVISIRTEKLDNNGNILVENKFVKTTKEQQKQYVYQTLINSLIESIEVPESWKDSNGNIDSSRIDFPILSQIGNHIGGYQFDLEESNLPINERKKIWFQWVVNPQTQLREKKAMDASFQSRFDTEISNYKIMEELMAGFIEIQMNIGNMEKNIDRDLYLQDQELLAHMRSPLMMITYLKSQGLAFSIDLKNADNFSSFISMKIAKNELSKFNNDMEFFEKNFVQNATEKSDVYLQAELKYQIASESLGSYVFLSNLTTAFNPDLEQTSSFAYLTQLAEAEKPSESQMTLALLNGQLIDTIVNIQKFNIKPLEDVIKRNPLALQNDAYFKIYYFALKNGIDPIISELEAFAKSKKATFEEFSKNSILAGKGITSNNVQFTIKTISQIKSVQPNNKFIKGRPLRDEIVNGFVNATEDLQPLISSIDFVFSKLSEAEIKNSSNKSVYDILISNGVRLDDLTENLKIRLRNVSADQIDDLYKALQAQTFLMNTQANLQVNEKPKNALGYKTEEEKEETLKIVGNEISERFLNIINDPQFLDFKERYYNMINSLYCEIQKIAVCTYEKFDINFIVDNDSPFWYKFNFVNNEVFSKKSVTDETINKAISAAFDNQRSFAKLKSFSVNSSTKEKNDYIQYSKLANQEIQKFKENGGKVNERALALGFCSGKSIVETMQNQSYFENIIQWVYNNPDEIYVQSSLSLFESNINSTVSPVKPLHASTVYKSPLTNDRLVQDDLTENSKTTFSAVTPLVLKKVEIVREPDTDPLAVEKFNLKAITEIKKRAPFFATWIVEAQKTGQLSLIQGKNGLDNFTNVLALIDGTVRKENQIKFEYAEEQIIFQEIFEAFENFYLQAEFDLYKLGGNTLVNAVRNGYTYNYITDVRSLSNQKPTELFTSIKSAVSRAFTFMTPYESNIENQNSEEVQKFQHTADGVNKTFEARQLIGINLNIATPNESYNSFTRFGEESQVKSSFAETITPVSSYLVFLNEARIGNKISIASLFAQQMFSSQIYSKELTSDEKETYRNIIADFETNKKAEDINVVSKNIQELKPPNPLYLSKSVLILAAEIRKEEIKVGRKLNQDESKIVLQRIETDFEWRKGLAPGVRKTLSVGPEGSKSRFFFDVSFYQSFVKPNQDRINELKYRLNNIESVVSDFWDKNQAPDLVSNPYISPENRNLRKINLRDQLENESDDVYAAYVNETNSKNDENKSKIIQDIRNAYFSEMEEFLVKTFGRAQIEFLRSSGQFEPTQNDESILNDPKAQELKKAFKLTFDAFTSELLEYELSQLAKNKSKPWNVFTTNSGKIQYEVKPEFQLFVDSTIPLENATPSTAAIQSSLQERTNFYSSQGLDFISETGITTEEDAQGTTVYRSLWSWLSSTSPSLMSQYASKPPSQNESFFQSTRGIQYEKENIGFFGPQ